MATCPAQSHRLVQGEEVEVFPRLDKLQCARFQPEGIAKNGLGRSVSVQSHQLSCLLALCDGAYPAALCSCWAVRPAQADGCSANVALSLLLPCDARAFPSLPTGHTCCTWVVCSRRPVSAAESQPQCHAPPNRQDNTVLQVLPDLSDWSYWGKDEVNGQPAYVYEYKQR